MKTNGSTPTPDRDTIIREATYEAAVFGWYDTSEAAQQSNLLTISVFDMGSMEPLPADATHKFYIMVNATAYMVTRQRSGQYQVEEHDQTERHREERELRTSVLDYALWYLQGEGAGYHPSQGPEARTTAIKELLGEGQDDEHDQADTYPVIRDVGPDIFYAPGSANTPAPRVSRQWHVQIGPYNACEVGLLGYHEDGMPALTAVDAEQEPEEE
jgi:hypothetical protein